MFMSAQTLKNIIEAPSPGFRCFAAGDKSGARFLAKIYHTLNPPASHDVLAQISAMLGIHAAPVVAFYEQHNGFLLYRDTLSRATGIKLLRVEEWEDATQDMRDWFSDLADEPENDPDHIITGISIATVPHSGNYFVMPLEGPTAGKIFYANHDGWYESAFADNFDHFLARVAQEPVQLLAEEVGCYTRYSDGKTDTQWIPETYFADVSTIPK